ncbi:MAG: hypothetical protein SGI89_05035 [bacterium]|nr:hypothetical protein [bacterium]
MDNKLNDMTFSLDNFLLPDIEVVKEYSLTVLDLPFKFSTSFHKLILHIREVAEQGNKPEKEFARLILKELDNAPELLKEIYDLYVFTKYEKVIASMMMFVFPAAFYEKQLFAATSSFMSNIFYSSPKFREIIKFGKSGIDGEFNIDMNTFNWGKNVSAYISILNSIYGLNINFEFPIVYKYTDPQTGLDRYYKLNMANEFMDVIIIAPRQSLLVKKLSRFAKIFTMSNL